MRGNPCNVDRFSFGLSAKALKSVHYQDSFNEAGIQALQNTELAVKEGAILTFHAGILYRFENFLKPVVGVFVSGMMCKFNQLWSVK